MPHYSEDQWILWMDELATNDHFVADKFISDDLYQRIMIFFKELENEEMLRKAGIGTSSDYQIRHSVRGDLIYWLQQERDHDLSLFFEQMDELTENIKRHCYLSLSGSEFHLAKYPAGTHYDRHVDQLNGSSNRKITVLLYLNENWKKGDGGELRMYRDSGDLLIEPIAQRLLVFKSEAVEHEVLTTHVPRFSLTGWLLHQPAALGYLLS